MPWIIGRLLAGMQWLASKSRLIYSVHETICIKKSYEKARCKKKPLSQRLTKTVHHSFYILHSVVLEHLNVHVAPLEHFQPLPDGLHASSRVA